MAEFVSFEIEVSFSTERMDDQSKREKGVKVRQVDSGERDKADLISLCKLNPRSTTGVISVKSDMLVSIFPSKKISSRPLSQGNTNGGHVHISLSINQNANVLSPTNAWS